MQLQTIQKGDSKRVIEQPQAQETIRDVQLSGKASADGDSVELSRRGRNLALKSEAQYRLELEAKHTQAVANPAQEKVIPLDYLKMIESLTDDPSKLAEFVRGIFKGSSAAQQIDAAVQSSAGDSKEGAETGTETRVSLIA